MRFPAVLVLKIVSGIFSGVILLLLWFVVGVSRTRPPDDAALAQGCILPFILLPAPIVLWLLNNAYSSIEVDEKGVRVRKWVGSRDVAWERIGAIRRWSQKISTHAGVRYLPHADVRSPEGQRLIYLGSRYGDKAISYLTAQAEARKIEVRMD